MSDERKTGAGRTQRSRSGGGASARSNNQGGQSHPGTEGAVSQQGGPNRNFGPGGWRGQPKPPGLNARLAAIHMLTTIVQSGTMLDERPATAAPEMPVGTEDARDKALARSIVIVSLRRLGSIRLALSKYLDKGLPRKAPALEWILVSAAAQILYMEVPDHAAVDLAVHATRQDRATAPFASLVNAVLRNIIRNREEALQAGDPKFGDSMTDTPQWLAVRWQKTFGSEAAQQIAAMNGCEPTLDVSVRDNPAEWAQKLDGMVLPTGSVRLRSHKPVQELEGYAEGAWWVQDVAAALPARMLAAQAGEDVADLCAAPGGKTIQLALSGAHVVALDKSAERMKRLSANLARIGLSAETRIGDALTFSGGPFDAILLDAPCTATGTIRRHPDVAWTKRASHIAALSVTQAKMLDHAAQLLKPGGRLVYCTCSLEPEEGELQIAQFLERNRDMKRLPIIAEEIGGLASCLNDRGEVRTLPCHLPHDDSRMAGMDGFFIARLGRAT